MHLRSILALVFIACSAFGAEYRPLVLGADGKPKQFPNGTDTLRVVPSYGLAANVPAAATSNTGQIYVATDTSQILRSNGTSWDVVGFSGSAGGDLGGTYPNPTVTGAADNAFTIYDETDPTKGFAWTLGNQTTGTVLTVNSGAQSASRQLSVPVLGGNRTLAVIDQAQTFTAEQDFPTITAGGGSYSADDSVLLIRKESTGVPNSHAVRDESEWTVASGGGGYASFDTAVSYSGASAYDHLHAFQSRPGYAGSGSLSQLVGFWEQADHDGAGTVANRYGALIQDITGSGPVTNNYGVYIGELLRGSSDYAIWTNGATPSRFGGLVTMAASADVTGSVTATGLFRTTSSYFEGPLFGGIAANAYFSGGWKYRADGYAVRFSDGQSAGAEIAVAASGTAGSAVPWVGALTATTSSVTFGSAVTVNSANTTDSTSKDTGGFVSEGGIAAEKAIFAGTSIRSVGPTSGIGYATGAGGTVTQTTNRTTGVTINKVCGQITLVSAAGSTSWQSFTVTNSAVAATDTITVNQASGTDLYLTHVTAVSAGSFRITYATTAGTTTEQPVFNFSVIKAVNN